MRELVAGLSTFSTLSYIIFVQPALLSQAGADFYTVLFATCVSSAFATFILGALTNLPFAIAPAMGHNVFFVITICGLFGLSFRQAMFVNFLSASVSLLISLTGILWFVVDKMPKALKVGITSGIGLLIGMVGFQWGGIIEPSQATMIKLSDIKSVPFVATSIGVLTCSVLHALGVKFAVLVGVATSTAIVLIKGYVSLPESVFSIPRLPENIVNIELVIPREKLMDILSAFLVLLILDVFDTAGTLVGLFTAANIKPEKKTVKRAFISDSLGAVFGTILGTTTLTTYIESAVGVQAGGKTKLTAFTVAVLFVASLFLLPVVELVGKEISYEGKILHPQIAPAMIFVGFMMLGAIKEIDFQDVTDFFPAVVTILTMGFSLSITDGIAFGFISYTLMKLLSGRTKELNIFVIIVTLIFAVKMIFE